MNPANPAAAIVAAPTFASPANILSIGALLLLLGTVGVLVVCRLALAALLILGPVFIVLALFEGTRGLFEGWLKSVAMFALVPLLTVVMGSGALVAIAPMVAGLDQAGGATSRCSTAVSILVASIIYLVADDPGVQGRGDADQELAARSRCGCGVGRSNSAFVQAHQQAAAHPGCCRGSRHHRSIDRIGSCPFDGR